MLTQLTALHIIQGRIPNWPLPTGQLSQLSSLTALRNLSSDAGAPVQLCWANRGYTLEAGQQAQAQAQQWGVALAGMPHLTRLELVQVLLCDEVLQTISSTAPQLQELSFNVATSNFAAATTAAGAAAIAHIPRKELAWNKPLLCQHNLALMRLPNLKVMRSNICGTEARDAVWSADTCICCDWERARQAAG